MTTLSAHNAARSATATAGTPKRLARRAVEIAIGLVIVAALTGAWIAFFSFVPFDLTPR